MMFKLLLCLLFVISSCATNDAVKAHEKLYQQVLAVQIEADKEHNVYVSDIESEQRFTILQYYEFALSEYGSDEPTYLMRALVYEPNPEKAIGWSKALAKYRFATNEDERLELINTLIEDSINKGVFLKTDNYLNCKTGKFVMDFEQETFISFRPTLDTSSLLYNSLRTNVYSREIADEDIERMLSLVTKLAKEQGKKHVRGILYAWTKPYEGTGYIQKCDMTFPVK